MGERAGETPVQNKRKNGKLDTYASRTIPVSAKTRNGHGERVALPGWTLATSAAAQA